MEICARVYRPRRARESPLFRLVEQHLEKFLRVYEERFAKVQGPLRPVVERVLRGFLTCGLVEHGFARLWCGTCRTSVLCPFSCRGRSFCPSCEKKKQLLWAEWLQKEVLGRRNDAVHLSRTGRRGRSRSTRAGAARVSGRRLRDASGRNPDPSALWFCVECDRSTGVKSEVSE